MAVRGESVGKENVGLNYERDLNRKLKKLGMQLPTFTPAGTDNKKPDAQLLVQGTPYSVELKLGSGTVDFGQGSLEYEVDDRKKTGKWIITGRDVTMKAILEKVGALKVVNQKWKSKGAPRRYIVPLKQFKPSDVKADYDRFSEEFFSLGYSEIIADYYTASKGVNYIQIKGKGLYYMKDDPANLKKLGAKEFKPYTELRVRLKRSHSIPIYDYRFATALQVRNWSLLAKSDLDLDNEDDLAKIREFLG